MRATPALPSSISQCGSIPPPGANVLWRRRCDFALSEEGWISVGLNSAPVPSLSACEFRVGGTSVRRSLLWWARISRGVSGNALVGGDPRVESAVRLFAS